MDRGKSRDTGSSVFWGTVQQGGRRMGLGARQRVHLTALTGRGPGWPTAEPHPITCERGNRQTQRCQHHTRQEAQPSGPERHVQPRAVPRSPRPGLLQGAGGLRPAQSRWPVPGHPRPTCSRPSAQPMDACPRRRLEHSDPKWPALPTEMAVRRSAPPHRGHLGGQPWCQW